MPFPTPTSTPSIEINYIVLIVIGIVGILLLIAIFLCYFCVRCEDQKQKQDQYEDISQPLEVVPGESILPPIFYTPDVDPLKQQDLREKLNPLL